MKKIFVLMLYLLSFTGCTAILEASNVKDVDASDPMGIVINKSDTEKINLPNEADILFFDDKQIIYSIEQWDKNNEFLDVQFYKYTIAEDTSIKLFDLTNYKFISGRISIHDGKLYIPCLFKNNVNKIFEVSLSTGDTTVLYEWIGNTFICNTYLENNTLFVFEIIPVNKSASSERGTNYKVTAFNLKSSSQKEIMSVRYQNGTGDVISCITVNDGIIYLYTLKYDNYNESTHILTYNISSGEFEEIPLISSELSDIGDDTVMDMFAIGNDIIFKTLNGQILIEKKQNNQELISINFPDNLGLDISSRYTVLDSNDKIDDYIYFATTNAQENTVYKFDYYKQELVPIKFDFYQDKLNILNYYFTNKSGDIIMESEDVSSSEVNYLLIKRETLE